MASYGLYDMLVVISAAIAGVLTVLLFWMNRQSICDVVLRICFKPGNARRPLDLEAQRSHASTRSLPATPPPSPFPPAHSSPLLLSTSISLPDIRSVLPLPQHPLPSPSPSSPPPSSPPSLFPPLVAPNDPPSIELRSLQESTSVTFNRSRNIKRVERIHGERDLPHPHRYQSSEEQQRQVTLEFRKHARYMQPVQEQSCRRRAGKSFDKTAIVDNDTSASPSLDVTNEPRNPIPDGDLEGLDACHDDSPRSSHSASPNHPDGIEEEGQTTSSHCSTCSELHTAAIPTTREAPVREPLTPTSPSGGLGGASDADIWAGSAAHSSKVSPVVQEEGLISQSESPLTGIQARPTSQRSGAATEASDESGIGDNFQDASGRYRGVPATSTAPASTASMFQSDSAETIPNPESEASGERRQRHQPRASSNGGQAITNALALQLDIPTGASRRPSATTTPPPFTSSHPTMLTPSQCSNVSTTPSKNPSLPRPHRIMTDPRLFSLANEDRPHMRRVYSPRLKLATLDTGRVEDKNEKDKNDDGNGLTNDKAEETDKNDDIDEDKHANEQLIPDADDLEDKNEDTSEKDLINNDTDNLAEEEATNQAQVSGEGTEPWDNDREVEGLMAESARNQYRRELQDDKWW